MEVNVENLHTFSSNIFVTTTYSPNPKVPFSHRLLHLPGLGVVILFRFFLHTRQSSRELVSIFQDVRPLGAARNICITSVICQSFSTDCVWLKDKRIVRFQSKGLSTTTQATVSLDGYEEVKTGRKRGRTLNKASRDSPAPVGQTLKLKDIEPNNTVEQEYSIPNGLSPEQVMALKHVIAGHNVFFSGPAGTGKSFLIKELVRYFQLTNKNHIVTSSTGISALHINGTTIHSALGIGTAEDTFKNLLHAMNPDKKFMLRRLSCVILDEISMISNTLLNCIDYIFQKVRKRNEPFGGVQMIVSGDFFQLSPVITRSTCPFCGLSSPVVFDSQNEQFTEDSNWELVYPFYGCHFAFESLAWKKGNFKMIDLKTNFRQDSVQLQTILNSIRYGEITPQVRDFIQRCSRPLDRAKFGPVVATSLYPTREKVFQHNLQEFGKLRGKQRIFTRASDFHYDEHSVVSEAEKAAYINYVDKSCGIDQVVRLKKAAQVVLVANKTKELVNGSRGVVVGFEKCKPEHLSEIRKKIDQQRIESYLITNGIKYLPRVLFRNHGEKVILPHVWTMQVSSQLKVVVIQMPLCLAWALTTHKSQGMTLDCLKINFDQTWKRASGLVYVGLSRVRSEEGLEISGFREDMIWADPKVKEFYKSSTFC